MQIRTRLTVNFALIVASILFLATITVYYFSAQYREQEFYDRLKSKAVNTAKLLIEVQEVSTDLLKIIDKNTVVLLHEKVVVYNQHNNEIYSSNETDTTHESRALLQRIRREKEVRFTEGKREGLGILYTDRKDQFVVVSYAYDMYGIRKIKNLRLVLIFVFFGCVSITLVAGWIFAGQSLKPISNVVNQVEKISASNLYERVDEGNKKDEIANLAINFNKMLHRLELAFKAQKSFVANASHELRTPLTSVKSQIEVTLIKARNTEQYEAVLLSVLEDINKMGRLSNGLLELAQMEMDNANVVTEEVRVDELLWQVTDELKTVYPQYKINIDYRVRTGEERFTTPGNEQLLKSALANIMDNACKFSADHQVWIVMEEGKQFIEIKFKDNGIGISAEDLRYVKEPFYRAVNTTQIKGHGLGLPLTDRIMRIHGGELRITSELNKGTEVTIWLPCSVNG